MSNTSALLCDGCGQVASPEHLARRLRRLEWSTRYRPVHIQALLLSAVSPFEENDFLYSPRAEFLGEVAALLDAAGIPRVGRPAEAVHEEMQKAGMFLTHVLECPLENRSRGEAEAGMLIEKRLPIVATRIRRSLKPKRVILVTSALGPFVDKIRVLEFGCLLVLDDGKPFAFDQPAGNSAVLRFRECVFAGGTD